MGNVGSISAALESLEGSYLYERFRLDVRRIPKDPYAPPGTGVCGVSVPMPDAGVPAELLETPARAPGRLEPSMGEC